MTRDEALQAIADAYDDDHADVIPAELPPAELATRVAAHRALAQLGDDLGILIELEITSTEAAWQFLSWILDTTLWELP